MDSVEIRDQIRELVLKAREDRPKSFYLAQRTREIDELDVVIEALIWNELFEVSVRPL